MRDMCLACQLKWQFCISTQRHPIELIDQAVTRCRVFKSSSLFSQKRDYQEEKQEDLRQYIRELTTQWLLWQKEQQKEQQQRATLQRRPERRTPFNVNQGADLVMYGGKRTVTCNTNDRVEVAGQQSPSLSKKKEVLLLELSSHLTSSDSISDMGA